VTDAEGRYFDRVGKYFGAEVGHLDALDAGNWVHQHIRRASLATLERTFSPPGPLLEIGYGAGFEAAHLAARGFRIVGLDPSAAMQARARERAAQVGVAERVDFRLGSTADLPDLAEEFRAAPFAGAYSTLGPFNLEPDLERASAALAALVAPGGALVAMIINRYCAWETAIYLASLDFKRAFRRQVRGWGDLKGAPGEPATPVFPHTPRAFRRAFARHFDTQEIFALPSLLPPPYASPTFERFGSLLDTLARADTQLRHRPLVTFLGDHFEVVLRRKAA
jgi:SAM-dependent methyltransferase